MAHPLRVQMLGLLRTHGPATATGLAARLGLTSGALSYHLRQLERFGFIAEDTEPGNQRDRWWRAVHRSTEFDSADLDPAAAEAGEAYEEGVIAAITRSLTAAQAERRSWPVEWQRAYNLSDVLLELTAGGGRAVGSRPARRARPLPPAHAGGRGPPGSRTVRRATRSIRSPVSPSPRTSLKAPARQIVGLLIGGAVAGIGLRVAALALPWFVLTSTGSAAQTGLVVACEFGPYIAAKALSGPVVDRWGQRRVSIVADLGSALAFGVIPALFALGVLPFPVLLIMVALGGSLRGPGDNAKDTSVPLVARSAPGCPWNG